MTKSNHLNLHAILKSKVPKSLFKSITNMSTSGSSSSNSAPPRKMITLTSSDGQSFEIEETVALQSKTLEFTIEESGGDDLIPLPNIKGNILAKVVEYCNKHAQTDTDSDIIDIYALNAWDEEFVRVDHGTLFDLILASNFLEIGSLLDLTSQAVGDMMKGKTPEELQKMFNIKNTLTREEEEEVRRENH